MEVLRDEFSLECRVFTNPQQVFFDAFLTPPAFCSPSFCVVNAKLVWADGNLTGVGFLISTYFFVAESTLWFTVTPSVVFFSFVSYGIIYWCRLVILTTFNPDFGVPRTFHSFVFSAAFFASAFWTISRTISLSSCV